MKHEKAKKIMKYLHRAAISTILAAGAFMIYVMNVLPSNTFPGTGA